MSPRASRSYVEQIKYWLEHQDSYEIDERPPIQNDWYELLDEDDVRLTWVVIRQTNDEVANKNIALRWTIDGVEYLTVVNATSGGGFYIYRNYPSLNLGSANVPRNANYNVDLRAHTLKIEVRITDVVGTNQILEAWGVLELFIET